MPKVDLSKVKPGIAVVHRAFGEGIVEKIETKASGSAYVHVKFATGMKQFGYPGAFYDGFLRVKG